MRIYDESPVNMEHLAFIHSDDCVSSHVCLERSEYGNEVRRISLTGIILKGRYCILEQIGRGGQGSLYLARDLELGVLWAVKELPLERKREAKLMRILEHPSLPKMTDYTERGEFCYLVMEFIRGKSLGEWLMEGRIFSLEEIVKIGMETAEVLKYLHTRKPAVYYGDLKPDNLMLTENGRLYLVDLGSAVFDYGDAARICEGTIGYAAPEQMEGRLTKASDVYAFGKTICALCGKKKHLYAIKNPRFGILLVRCLRHEERRRYQDMDALKKGLSSVEKYCEKHSGKNLLGGILLLCVFFLAAIGVLSFLSGKRPLETAMTGITQHYYEADFLSGSREKRRKICSRVEEELQGLLREYQDKKSQRKLLLLLALNGELQGEEEHAAVYYEQLLLYDRKFGEAYGQYGLFLCRRGLQAESRHLWERFCQVSREGTMEDPEPETKRIWMERIGEDIHEKKQKKENMEKE